MAEAMPYIGSVQDSVIFMDNAARRWKGSSTEPTGSLSEEWWQHRRLSSAKLLRDVFPALICHLTLWMKVKAPSPPQSSFPM